MKKDNTPLEYAYDFCLQIARSHYENFPVASLLVPQPLRRPIAAIYAFARRADDIADEGDLTAAQRLQELEQYQENITAITTQNYDGHDPVFIALADTVERFHLPTSLLTDLLSAFKQDVTQKEYKDWDDVLDYCQRSANPVGRLLLHLNQSNSVGLLKQSDAICTGLQLINFLQDIKQDYFENQRIYLPLQDLDRNSLGKYISSGNSLAIAPMLREHYLTTVELFNEAYSLGTQLNGRLAWEIRSITLSGLFILKLLSEQTDEDLFSRPRLKKHQLILLTTLALTKPMFSHHCEQLIKQITRLNENN